MPAQPGGMGGMFKKLGGKLLQAHQQAKGETTTPNAELPSGIENGIAQIVECKFDQVKVGKENAGEWFFYAAASVKKPEYFEGQKTLGGRTSIMTLLCDTPKSQGRKTLAEHVAWMYEHLRSWGVDTNTIQLDKDPQALEKVAAAIKQMKPHIMFKTFKMPKATTGPYKDREPRTLHTWKGAVEYDDTSSPTDFVQEAPAATPFNEFETPVVATAVTEEPDLDELLRLAKSDEPGHEDAGRKLAALAIAAGATEEDVESATWDEVVLFIQGDHPVGVEPSESVEEPWIPGIGEVYTYQIIDPKTGQPALDKNKQPRKPIEVQVKKVDEVAQTVDAVDNITKKVTYKNIGWKELLSAG